MANVVLGTANDGFRNSFIAKLKEWADRASANIATGTANTRRNAETLAQFAQFVSTLDRTDPRFISIETASIGRGNRTTEYEPSPMAQRLLANSGVQAEAQSNDQILGELLACDLRALVDLFGERFQRAVVAQQEAEEQRDQLAPVVDQNAVMVSDLDRKDAQIAELEAELREARKNIEYLRAAEKPSKLKATA